jgi:6-phosphofructokinase
MRLGILTGGGDCPGLNAVIRAVVTRAIRTYDGRVLGIEDGWLTWVWSAVASAASQRS